MIVPNRNPLFCHCFPTAFTFGRSGRLPLKPERARKLPTVFMSSLPVIMYLSASVRRPAILVRPLGCLSRGSQTWCCAPCVLLLHFRGVLSTRPSSTATVPDPQACVTSFELPGSIAVVFEFQFGALASHKYFSCLLVVRVGFFEVHKAWWVFAFYFEKLCTSSCGKKTQKKSRSAEKIYLTVWAIVMTRKASTTTIPPEL